ncbi:MAG: poly-gamma-glutamate biosynthesis protein PgsC [Candidatus Stahlbacteria bacterium]|nr:poly-gamma-glutamate biosynthesis protein PgsC [Candidatus Stahlbacteria bacterium]
MVPQAIGLGLVISLIFSETLGVTAGGMVVPGYIALMMDKPLTILITIVIAIAALLTLRMLSNLMFIYGKRRFVIVILIGFIYGELCRRLLILALPNFSAELMVVGYIIPGLIANWMDRQGIVSTLCVMIVTAIFVRLLLILLTGGKLILL